MKTKLNPVFYLILFIYVAMGYISCSDDKNTGEYDPNQQVKISSFYPDSGGMATKVIMEGENFGTDISNIRVWFNQKQAAVISSTGNKLYMLVPRLPGDTCVISMRVGNDTLVYNDKNFRYFQRFAVTTIAGQPGTNGFVEGTLASAQYGEVQHVAVDKENNVFVAERDIDKVANCSVLNEKNNTVNFLFSISEPLNVPTIEEETQIVFIPRDDGELYYELSPDNMWIARTRQILHPSVEQQASGMKDFPQIRWKHSFAFSEKDGMIYTRCWAGYLIKIDPKTRVGQLVYETPLRDTDSYLVFDPRDPAILYISYADKHCIYTYNLDTGEHTLFAGSEGIGGWNDGDALDAEFNKPRQLTLDLEGNLYVADEDNHCIRMIDQNGIVTTPIGLPGKWGYVDGDPEVALLNRPKGVAVDSNGDVYIADHANKCVRKLTLQ